MATDRPRVYVTLDRDLYEEAERLAKKRKVSLSLFLRDKIREAMDWHESFELMKDGDAIAAIRESLAEIRRGDAGTLWRDVLADV